MKQSKFPELSKGRKVPNVEFWRVSVPRSRFHFMYSLFLFILLVLLGMPSSGAFAASSPLKPPQGAIPIATSGEPFNFSLVPVGGTPPYRCVPANLGIGTLRLNAACVISGRAPRVTNLSNKTGFVFHISDSSTPPQVINYSGFSLMTKAAATHYTPQSFDGVYTINTTGTITTDFHTAGTPPVVVSTWPKQVLNVVNGSVMGTQINMSNSELGVGHVTLHPAGGNGITLTYSYTFSLSLTGFAASVTGIGSVHGTIAGTPATITGSLSFIGQRTSNAP